MLTTVEKKPSKKAQTPEVPEFLVKEVIDGVSYYYKNYREVLNKTKTPEEIIGCSGLQSLILEYFVFNVCVLVDRKKYRIFTNEPGNHLGPNNNVSYDIAIFDRSVLVPEKIDIHYVDVPPKMILEVDVRIELIDTKFATAEEYIL